MISMLDVARQTSLDATVCDRVEAVLQSKINAAVRLQKSFAEDREKMLKDLFNTATEMNDVEIEMLILAADTLKNRDIVCMFEEFCHLLQRAGGSK